MEVVEIMITQLYADQKVRESENVLNIAEETRDFQVPYKLCTFGSRQTQNLHTAILGKVIGKNARDSPESPGGGGGVTWVSFCCICAAGI